MTSAVERLEAISRSWRLQHDALKIVRREVFRKAKANLVHLARVLDAGNTTREYEI